MTLSDLLKQREALATQQAALEKALMELQGAQRQEAIANIRALMAENGLTVADLADVPGRKPGRPKGDKGASAQGGKQPVAAKYRDKATGATWSGRGLKPRWLTAAIEAGAKAEDFLIQPAG